MTYILPTLTHSTFDPVRVTTLVERPDEGLFYVRWWGEGSTSPVEHQFTSRAQAEKAMTEFLRNAPYTRIELLEATEWGTRQTRARETR